MRTKQQQHEQPHCGRAPAEQPHCGRAPAEQPHCGIAPAEIRICTFNVLNFSNNFLFLFLNKMLVFRAGIHTKKHVTIANREVCAVCLCV